MEESKNHLLDGINLHDADVSEIRFEGKKVVFEIPVGLVNDAIPVEEWRPCRLRFTTEDDLEDTDWADVHVSRRFRLFGTVCYFTIVISLKKLAEILKKKKGCFEIVTWNIENCGVGFEGYLYYGRKSRNLNIYVWTRDMEFIED